MQADSKAEERSRSRSRTLCLSRMSMGSRQKTVARAMTSQVRLRELMVTLPSCRAASKHYK